MSRRPFLVMGVVNVTPDSFSDGGRYDSVEKAVARGIELWEQGADILDIGGESSRPGSDPVTVEEERRRVLPVIAELRQKTPAILSVDTYKPEVAELALKAGAALVNDISGAGDIRMIELARAFQATLILMHMQNKPKTMQLAPSYPDGVVNEVKAFLSRRVNECKRAGLTHGQLWIDPGFGFGKTYDHNLTLLRALSELQGIADRIVVGTSRKSFLSRLGKSQEGQIAARGPATLATNIWALEHGATVFRAHDVLELKRSLSVWDGLSNAG